MSNERRHELETNDLAILLERVNKAIEPYSKAIAIGIGVLIVALIGWMFYSSQQTGERSDSTLDLIQGNASQDPEVLMEVSNNYPGTAAAAWALVYQGQLQLSEGIQTLYRDRVEAEQLLGDAKTAFQSAMSASSDSLLRSRAQLGIARAAESLGELDQAVEAYQQVVKIGESEAIIEQAEQRIAAIGEPRTEEFLAWFSDQDFAPADPSLPPSMPGFGSLPDMPDLKLTELPGGEAKDEEIELEDEPAEAKAEESPAEESPAEESPAEESGESSEQESGDTPSEDTADADGSDTASEDPEGGE